MDQLRPGVFMGMADIVPTGRSGQASVEHFTIAKDTFQGWQTEHTIPGRYAMLRIDGRVVMSDTDMELRTNTSAVMDAKGDVLIGGLGLGMVVLPIILKPSVTSVRVVEINEDVLKLVIPSLEKYLLGTISTQTGQHYVNKLKIERDDIRAWRPKKSGRQFDYIYFDIWKDMCVDHVDEMKDLHLAFRRYLRPGGKVTSWQYDHLRYLKRQGRWR